MTGELTAAEYSVLRAFVKRGRLTQHQHLLCEHLVAKGLLKVKYTYHLTDEGKKVEREHRGP